MTEPASAADVAAVITKAACAVVLEPDAPTRLGDLRLPDSGDLVLVVGPEGGITEAESAAFLAAGAHARRLGPTVLRTSTAGPVAAAWRVTLITAGRLAAAILLSRSRRW